MGDINLDMTKNKRFLAIPYTCAAIGAAIGLHTAAASSLGGLVTAGAVGAVAGGIGIPMALTGVAVVAYVGFVGLKETFKALKKEGAVVPMGMALVALNCAKALFVTPFQAAAKLFKGFGGKPKGSSQAAPSAPESKAPSKVSDAKASNAFTKANEPAPSADKPTTPPPAPKPPVP